MFLVITMTALGVALVLLIRWGLRRDDEIRSTYPDEDIYSNADALRSISESQSNLP